MGEGRSRPCDRPGEAVPEALFGREVKTTLELFWVSGNADYRSISIAAFLDPMPERQPGSDDIYSGRLMEVNADDIEEAAAESNGKFDLATHRRYRFVVTMEQGYPEDGSAVHAASLGKVAARVSGALFYLSSR